MSQDELAERVERDQRSISEYENGKRRIYAHDLPKFALALQVPISYFFEAVASPDDLDAALISAVSPLTSDEKRQLLDVVRLLVGMLRRDP